MIHKSPDRVAIFAGTFAPFTIGHASIVERGLEIFDRVVICIGVNASKHEASSAEERRAAIAALYEREPRVEVLTWSGLTAEAAAQMGARFLLRGVRSVKDYEYERDMADANKALFGLETVILFAEPQLAHVTSSLVRDLQSHGYDASALLPRP